MTTIASRLAPTGDGGGTGYFDDMTTVIQGGSSSVTALTGSTEEEQFH
ncbi:hypothetical protein [Pseudomonas sp. P8_241]|nr:hypothetical protein [Pseudomonas sp. P8_241]WPN45422.1 hypothetical protein QMK58_19920 [Pseudomonas sp. P8_241]